MTEEKVFIGELEVMDITPLMDKQYMIAVSSGEPDECSYIPNSLHGPYDVWQMAENVYKMWRSNAHHARVIVCSTKPGPPPILDPNTLDFLEAQGLGLSIKYLILNDVPTEYTCVAGFIPTIKDYKREENSSIN